MDLNTIKQAAGKLMIDRRVHIDREKGGAYYHGERVAGTVLILRNIVVPEDCSYDDILTVASWFHDIGKGIEPHNVYGAVLAKEALREYCSPKEVDEIAGLIELHCERCPQSNDYTAWVKLLQDADLIDHFGTFTIWMDFLHSSFEEKSIEQTFTYDEAEWEKHCQKYRNLLNYDVSKSIIDDKINFINEFYARFRVEGRGGIYKF
jgi:uncharacterized protein